MASSVLLMLALASSPGPAATASAHSAGIGAVRSTTSLLVASSSTPAPSAPAPASADAHFTRGVEALKAKDTPAAITALSACAKAAPTRVDCRWELGWAYYVESRWPEALAQWTEVKRLAPQHPGLEDALSQAQGQVRLQQKLAESSQGPARPPPPKGARVRIRAVGDVMLGTDFPEGHLPPEGPASVLAGVSALLQDADLTFANLEGPLCDSGQTKKCRGSSTNCYAFRTPTSYARVLAEAGLDIASTANNHAGDFGEVCRRET